MALIGLACDTHPTENYAQIGLRTYADGTMEPYLVATGMPLAIADMKIGVPLGEAMTLNIVAYVDAVEVGRKRGGDEAAGPVAQFTDQEADHE